jgi:NADP-dependent aldehyde dehydrogenase
MSELEKVLIAGRWRAADPEGSFRAVNPRTREPIARAYPVSSMNDVTAALEAGWEAAKALRALPAAVRASFLERYAARIEARAAELVASAHEETALPVRPRLLEVELPRTVGQLRQAAAAARDGGWCLPTIDTRAGIRSRFGPLAGAVAVFGPNNFPFAFNSAAGGDFAAAVAAGNVVIAKANTSHPGTTRLFAEEALEASREAGLPAATVQLIYRTSHETGERLVAHRLLGATGYTGSRAAGLALKAAADRAGKPIYLELSSINPVVILPGALRERSAEIAAELQTSCLMGTGQFCTNPGLILLLASRESEAFVRELKARFEAAPAGTLLGERVEDALARAVEGLQRAGAEVVTGGERGGGEGFSYRNTVLRVEGESFLARPEALQEEAFGNATLLVIAAGAAELERVIDLLDGNLTGSIYSRRGGEDDDLHRRLAAGLRLKVGRLLDDKMPTGVAVSPAMSHGGPYPATGHPGFTAVGIPASLRRFAQLECYDNVRAARLPPELRDENPTGALWRFVDGAWTQGDIGG